jgi:hypothetical protein
MKYNINNLVLQLILLIILVQLFSCTAGSCFDETESRVKATFFSLETGKAFAPDSVTLYGVDMDSLKIYDKSLKLKSPEFPLNADDTTCKFVLRINGINDTLSFSYSNYTYLISKECGYTFFFTIDTAIHSMNIIKSISIIKKTITTFNEENMRIFF